MKLKKTKFVQIESTDHLLLPGLLFEPSKKTNKVAITLHGNGSSNSFYGFDSKVALADELNKKQISLLAFNNRGAHYIHKLHKANEKIGDNGVKAGTAFELIKDCVYDIDGALEFLHKLGYKEYYLIGYSTGANKICVYNYYRPRNKITKYVLAGGGDDTGILMDWMGGPQKLKQHLKKAKSEIDKGNGEKMIPKYILDEMLSYQSFYDTCNPDGDYNIFPFNEYMNKLALSKKKIFREYQSIKKPTLVVYGGMDEYCYGDVGKIVDILKRNTINKKVFDFEIIEGADHSFTGKEKEFAILVANWLTN